jgi:hypothetical protein
MTIAIHQPNFLPWIGYFHKITMVDKFVFLDDVQFPRGQSYGNRVLIKTKNGTHWLTIPVLRKSDLLNFNEMKIDYSGRQVEKLLKTIKINYSKSPFFEEILNLLENHFLISPAKLYELNIKLIKSISEYLGISTKFILSSKIPQPTDLSGGEKILEILKSLDATEYVSGRGSGSSKYINKNDFRQAGIKLTFQNFTHPQYKQLYRNFKPHLSIVDLLCNCGKGSFNIIRPDFSISKK